MRTLQVLALTAIALPLIAQTHVSTSVSGPPGRPVATTSGLLVAAAPSYHPSRVLVRFKNGAAHQFLQGTANSRGFAYDSNLFVVDLPPGLSVKDTVSRYKGNSNVLRSEPDYLVQAIATPTDPMWSQQWDMTKISAPTAWDTQTNASDVVVAIIDTGIDYTHLDLQANLWTNPVDNSHGFNCIGGTCVAGGLDDFGHGTHVAGTIGATTNNGIGIAGLNWSVKMMSMKFLDSNGSGAISDAVAAFQKILALKNSGVNIRVTSNSWGGGGYSQELKDAMAAVEAAGIIDICAAGNSGVNADVSPMYPGAYDNRGIVSVLASDSNDVGAGFTNYGLASVDIAAPGVSTLSTVPTGSCTLCDPSGYKLLSGTSMATPHVSGVAAALLHQRPGLSAAEARDILLDPASYDVVTDARAASTSTGGRLNFPKTLANPRLAAPIVLNTFPTLSMGPSMTVNSGAQVNLSATANDADAADVPNLRMNWGRTINTGTQWLFGYELALLFPSPSGSSTNFTAPTIARAATVPYVAGVADNRGGGAAGMNYVTVNPSSNPGAPPTGSLSVSSTSIPVGSTLGVTYSVSDPEGGPVYWDLWATGMGGASGFCCYSGTTGGLIFNSAGVYRIRTQGIDRELNTSDHPSVVVSVGGATGVPPLASAVFDKLSGPAPLTVNIDMSGSTDPDGTVQWYFFLCNNGFATGTTNPQGSCTFTDPGSYWVELQIQDNSGLVDLISGYVVVTPPSGGSDTTPPAVSISTPTAGPVSGAVNLTANASDASGIMKVEYRLDSAGGAVIGSSNTSPYSVAWNTTTVTPGSHTLYAIATDNANNPGTSQGVGVTVIDITKPAVAIATPAPGNVSGTVSLTATASDLSGILKVDYRLDSVNGTLIGTSSTSPYTVSWNTTLVAGGSHSLYAVATDNANNAGTSAAVNVTVIDNTAPAVSISSPSAGNVSGTVTLTASASDVSGIKQVDYRLDTTGGPLIGSAAVSPYSVNWNTTTVSAGSHIVYAIATDTSNNAGFSAGLNVTVDNTPPAVQITSPSPGALVSGTVPITATASDASGIKQVDFRLDATNGTLIGTAVSSPYTVNWNTAGAAAGNHILYAIATDKANNAAASAGVGVSTKVILPTVTITSPTTTSVPRKSTVTITAAVTPGSYKVARVDISVANTVTCSPTIAPYTCAWSVPAAAGKSYQLKAVAYDDHGGTSPAATITVTAK